MKVNPRVKMYMMVKFQVHWRRLIGGAFFTDGVKWRHVEARPAFFDEKY